MCGIAGFLVEHSLSEICSTKMIDSLSNRGPDSRGKFYADEGKLFLGHTRLAIQDLSDYGHQPMQTINGRYTIVFNGEIYNHLSVRKALEKVESGIFWSGHSDTETLLRSVECLGLDETLKLIHGMFAFALYDSLYKTITLVRDRVGEKPLYYGWINNDFLFASELSAFKAHKRFEKRINHQSLNLYLRYGCVPDPFSIFEGIHKLSPGHKAIFNHKGEQINIIRYWDSSNNAQEKYKGSYTSAVNDLDILLKNSVQSQMISDVNLGAFLSGGIDSSLVVSLMSEVAEKTVNTFTIGFNDKRFNEAEHAKSLAKHFNTNHTELYLSEQDLLDVIPSIHSIYSEPFADQSQIPTYIVSKLARQTVTVALSGDGGDELFAGYNRYHFTQNYWPKISSIPRPIRSSLSKGIQGISEDKWDFLLGKVLSNKHRNIGFKLHKAARLLSSQDGKELYLNMLSRIHIPNQFLDKNTHTFFNNDWFEGLNGFDLKKPVQSMMDADLKSYLPWDILVKVDRAAMANSLETRAPFLDHSVIEFAHSLPIEYRMKKQGKQVLKEVLYKYTPKELVDRPKMGFGIPLDSWMKGALRDWVEELLSPVEIIGEGIFNSEFIQKCWQEHLSGKRNWAHELWTIVMFRHWLKNF
jgi:asparagine synthase (glutamine-hydrolysing)